VLVNYADDFVVLCRRDASGALAKIRKLFAAIGLEINESKTSVRQARLESFDSCIARTSTRSKKSSNA
jgi:RNA-directed DNA polymerase